MTAVVTGAAGHIGTNLARAIPVRARLIGMGCGSGTAANASRQADAASANKQ